MTIQLRPYQQEAANAAVKFFKDLTRKHNALIVAATGAGKTLIIAETAKRLNSKILVFCPTKELIEQDYEKAVMYGLDCACYSASVGKKDIAQVTFATIGSVRNDVKLFADFDYIMIDEAHGVNPKKGVYKRFLSLMKKKVVGLTATPYRLESHPQMDWRTKQITGRGTSELKMLTSYRNATFSEIIYNVETSSLVKSGYLEDIRYIDLTPSDYNTSSIPLNFSGSDFDEKALNRYETAYGKKKRTVEWLRRIMYPKDGNPRNGILVFVRFVDEAQEIAAMMDGAAWISGDMGKKERENIIRRFKDGEIKVLVNANILAVGFDYPALDTVVMATPTMSLARYTQIVGRAIRKSPNKGESWFIDLCGNYKRFGRTDGMKLENGNVYDMNGNLLTGIIMRQ